MDNIIEFIDTWGEVIDSASKKASFDTCTEWEDIRSELILFLLENPMKDGATKQQVKKALYAMAMKKGAELRQQQRTLSPQYCYRTSDLRKIFEELFSEVNSWEVDVSDPERKYTKDGVVIDDFEEKIVIRSDVSWAYSQLPFDYKYVIFRRYGLKEEFEKNSKEARQYYRAMERLADVINSYFRPDNRRRAVSNSTAQAIITNDYSGRRVYPPPGAGDRK